MALDPLLDFAVDLDDVRDRLSALSYFLSVQNYKRAADAIENLNATPPACFVSVSSEVADEDMFIGGAGGSAQRVNVIVSALFCEPAAWAQDDGGEDQIEMTRRAVIRQLRGWTPRNAAQAFRYRSYQLRGLVGGLIWGEVLMRTTYRL